jgi:hypothetical protein
MGTLLVLPAGCGSNRPSETGGTGGSAPVALADLCPLFTNDLCIYLMQCVDAPFRDIDHCKAEVDCYGLPQLTAAAAAGSVRYDPSKVGACHQRFLADPCHFGFFLFTPDIYEVLSYCPGTVTPEVAPGGACDSSGECAGGYCKKTNDTCPGVCIAFPKAGEPCPDGQCDKGLFCTQAQVCAPPPKAGAPCATLQDCVPGGYCVASSACPTPNLFCDATTKTCQAGAGLGAPCGVPQGAMVSDQILCDASLWCDAVFLDKSGVCRMPGGMGATCNDQADCTGGLHCIGYVPFSTGPGVTPTLGTCSGPSSAGGACQTDLDCVSGLRCSNSVCTSLAASGEQCSQTTECQSGLVCWGKKCVHPAYPGDPCTTDADCVLSLCKAGVCRDHAKVGEPCVTGNDCTTGACPQGTCADTSICAAP